MPKALQREIEKVLDAYPKIYFACHTRHVQDPRTRRSVSAHQASILDHLDSVEPTSLMDLAKHMGVTPSTMSITLDRLARHGYVERRRDPNDRRRSALRLTEAGERIRRAQSVLEPTRVEGMLDTLSVEERTRALHGLSLLASAAERFMSSGPPKKLIALGRRSGRSSVQRNAHRESEREKGSDKKGPERDHS
ncbi:MAG TPA: MarR family winged helix-turn-helix transcriptional regulator [Candidatus Acidoferrales bacterium]|nr:MarR family winged helix-turn-helix transcriptional regulator [Candidatus Acidoferrales bacterium]